MSKPRATANRPGPLTTLHLRCFMAAVDLTAARLRELLHYDPETGVFTWKIKRSNVEANQPAGAIARSGYRVIGIDRALHLAHRLAFLFQTGEWPKGQVDHRNGLRDCNAWANLRDVDALTNGQNRRVPKRGNPYSTTLGATWCSFSGRWIAKIRIDGRYVHLGRFDTQEEAGAAYMAAKMNSHPGFVR